MLKDVYRIVSILVLIGLLFPPHIAAADGQSRPHRTAGDPLPRIQCPAGYTTTIYAEGLTTPDGLAFNPDGVLYVSEEAAGRVSRIEVDGSVSPVLTGLVKPEGIAFDDVGNLYVVEDIPELPSYPAGGRLIKMTPAGITTTLATDLEAPEGVVWTSDGTIYLTESDLQFIDPANALSSKTYVTAVSPPGGPTRIVTNTFPSSYAGITVGPNGVVYVTNETSGKEVLDIVLTEESIFAIDPTTETQISFTSGLISPEGLHFSGSGGFPLYVAEEDITGNGNGRISRVEFDGSHTPICTGFNTVEDVIVDSAGRLYVSEDNDNNNGLIILIEPETPQSIVLLIGDGMGEDHRTAARWSTVGQAGLLAMDDMPETGWARTSSADEFITDSAAAGTALATGIKTNNRVIGQDPDGNALLNILERAQAKGMAVGLVSNTQMAHATPASFVAHVPNRNMMTEIASQMLAAEVEVLLGGGEDEFLPSDTSGCYPQLGERDDGRNLIDEAITVGYSYVCDATSFTAVDPVATPRLLGLFADEGMPRPFSPSLAEMTQKAIDILSKDPDGFFLLVEGGQIDWASHANDATHTISDTIGFDEAVGVAKTFAATAPNTLVIVGADHETGGMSADLTSSESPGEDGPFSMPDATPFYVNWTSSEHTAVDVPVTAQGTGSDQLSGSYENTHIHDVMCQVIDPIENQLKGHLFEDTDGNGTQDSVEPDLPGVTVIITDSLGVTQTVTTNNSGDYLTLVPLGETALKIDDDTLPEGFALTTANDPQIVTVTACPLTISEDIGFQPHYASILKIATPTSSLVERGDWITYTVTVINNGGLASNVVISDTLDLSKVNLVISHTSLGSLTGPNPVLVTNFALDTDQGVTLTLGVTVTMSAATTITNVASVNSDQTELTNSLPVTHIVTESGSGSDVYLPIIIKK